MHSDNPTLAEKLASAIADGILDGSLKPGIRLDEISLAQQHGVSRTPVREAIRQLSMGQREIIVLREYEELSYQEIAGILNCPVGTVMSRLARARSRLRALLSKRGNTQYGGVRYFIMQEKTQ